MKVEKFEAVEFRDVYHGFIFIILSSKKLNHKHSNAQAVLKFVCMFVFQSHLSTFSLVCMFGFQKLSK